MDDLGDSGAEDDLPDVSLLRNYPTLTRIEERFKGEEEFLHHYGVERGQFEIALCEKSSLEDLAIPRSREDSSVRNGRVLHSSEL